MDLTPRVAKTLRSDENSAVFCEKIAPSTRRVTRNISASTRRKKVWQKTMDLKPRVAETLRSDENSAAFCEELHRALCVAMLRALVTPVARLERKLAAVDCHPLAKGGLA